MQYRANLASRDGVDDWVAASPLR